jgi:GntR family transcriptional regulator
MVTAFLASLRLFMAHALRLIRLRDTLYYGTEALGKARQAMTTSSRPVYLKLRDMIAAAIIDGHYQEGEMLPSVRALASKQGANPLTVAKAYQQFQTDGLVAVQRGVGMYVVAGAAERLKRAEREHFLQQEWPAIRAKIDRLGISSSDLMAKA